ncbi:MAG: hypothetical protein FWF05_08390 [Oscillospiraceae bacterium]|nr:hypothetical protein [Oscillospiraceae bacterium]
MDLIMKALRLHTLRGDIQQLGMETGYNKRGIRGILFERYVCGMETPITKDEFDSVLTEEYAKVKAWRAKRQGN